MTKEVQIEALRPFNRTPQGDTCEVGDRFAVPETRAEELERLGLAKRVAAKSGEKAAPEPENKVAPRPENKFARSGFASRKRLETK